MNVYISTRILKEKFVAKYDVTAMSLVALGTLIIIFLSNKTQQIFTTTDILELLLAAKSVAYFVITIVGMISVKFFMPTLLTNLREFERACE